MTTDARPIYPKHFFSQPLARRRSAFILMPFSSHLDEVHKAIRSAAEGAGLEPFRADDEFNTRDGMEKILRGIGEAEVIVADMTGKNPNVFYEVGIAHCMKSNVVLLAQAADDIPFDLRHIDHVIYRTSTSGLEELVGSLAKVLRGLDPEPAPREGVRATVDQEASRDFRAARKFVRSQIGALKGSWAKAAPQQANRDVEQFGDRAVPKFETIRSAVDLHRPVLAALWAPIEELGLTAIELGELSVVRETFSGIDALYSLATAYRTGRQFVDGQGPLLGLETWFTWTAKALDLEEWNIVGELLHHKFEFADNNPDDLESFPRHREVHYPAAALGHADLAARIIYDRQEEFAVQHFSGLNRFRLGISFAMFATALNGAIADQADAPLFPSWTYAPRDEFRRAIWRLERDPGYSQAFVQAVTGLSVSELNALWESGLRNRLQTFGVESDSIAGRRLLPLPVRFAD